MMLSNADALHAIRVAIAKHQKQGGGAGDTWDLAIFRAGYAAGMEAAAEIVRRYLVSTSQRAVSWHEVQDTLDAIREAAK